MNNLTAYKCLECGHYTISKYDGKRCAKCNGVLKPMGNATYVDKKQGLSVDVNIKNNDEFKEILSIIKELIENEKVPVEVREKVKEKILSVIESKS